MIHYNSRAILAKLGRVQIAKEPRAECPLHMGSFEPAKQSLASGIGSPDVGANPNERTDTIEPNFDLFVNTNR